MLDDEACLVLDGVEFRALCGPVNFFHTKLGKPCLYGAGFVHSVETEEDFPQAVDTKLEETCLKCNCILWH